MSLTFQRNALRRGDGESYSDDLELASGARRDASGQNETKFDSGRKRHNAPFFSP